MVPLQFTNRAGRLLSACVLLVLFAFLACFHGRPVAAGGNTKPPIPVSTGPDGYTYFPNGNTNPSSMQYAMDGRMLALASAGNATLSGSSVNIKCGSPAGASNMEIGIFDGDQLSFNSGGGNWDQGGGSRTIYQLYANPTNGRWEDLPAGSQALETWTSDQMADNAWVTLNDNGVVTGGVAAGVTNRASAAAASGNYFYVLHIYLETPTVLGMINCFKLRARSPMSISPTNFGILAAYNGTAAEQAAIYPAAGVTTYDGTWAFFQDVPQSAPTFGIWDGDFDYGDCFSYYDWSTNPPTPHTSNTDAPRLDTADADTQTWLQQHGITNGIAPFAQTTVGVVAEGIGKGTKVVGNATAFRSGSPADDNANLTLRRSPAICYDIIDPTGNVFTNPNPSGNAEWERFQLTSDPNATPAMADYGPGWGASTEYGNDPSTSVSSRIVTAPNGIIAGQNLPAGTWELLIRGMDMGNLNAILPDYDLLGVTRDGVPITPLRPYTIQGLVSNGCDGSALKGITLDLQDAVTGALQAQALTDANGAYVFWVAGGSYTVAIDPGSLTVGNWAGNGGVSSQTLTVAGANGSASFVLMPPPALTGNATVTLTTDSGACTASASRLTAPAGNCAVVSVKSDAPAQLGAGATTVTWTGTDGAGRTTTFLQTVTVTDKEAPVFTGSAAVTLNTDPGQCTASGARVPVPAVTDNCSGSLTPVGTVPATLAVGSTTVTWTATDTAGNVSSFSQTIVVADQEPPTITCPADVKVNADAGGSTASNVTLGTPVTADNCGVASVTNNAPAGFPAGKTAVTWTVTDTSGNTTTCTQNVTVVALGGLCGCTYTDKNANKSYEATTDAALPAVTVSLSGPSTGKQTTAADGSYSFSNLVPGTYAVTTTTPACGQKLETSQTLTVAVPAGQVVPNNNFGYVLGTISGTTYTDKNANSTYDNGSDSALGSVTVTLTGTDMNGQAVNATTTTAADGNYSFTGLVAGSYTMSVPATASGESLETAASIAVTLPEGGNKPGNNFGYVLGGLSGYTYTDKNTNSTYETSTDTALGGVTVTLSGPVTGTSTTAADGSYSFGSLPAGTYTVTTTTTASGEALETSQKLTVTVPAGQFVPNNNFGYVLGTISGTTYTDKNLNSSYDSASDSALGGVTVTLTGTDVNGQAVNATTTTAANGSYSFPNLLAGSYTVGAPVTAGGESRETAGSLSVALPAGGSSANNNFGYLCSLTISGPAAVSLNTDAGSCSSKKSNLSAPTVADGCFASTTLTNDAPALLPVGTTTVTWTATDAGGNTKTFVQAVTVTDNQVPTITAPADKLAVTDAGKCTASNVALGTPVTADNCGVKSVTNNAPTTFPVGVTTVTWTVTDNSGNTATATEKVTVTDNQAPTITAPADKSVSMDAGKCTASSVTLGTPVTADNCGVKSVTNNAPATFPVGVTTVTWTATDNSGNTATAAQKVTVVDSEKPTITCPANMAVTADSGKTTASNVSLGTPTTADNCGVASVTNNAPASYPAGTTTVTWTVTDTSGNTNTCTQTVTVTAATTTASLGDFVWFDANGNGIQDAGEPGIANVTVKLYTSTGTLVATTITSSAGAYSFTKLSAGSYYVVFTAPSGYTFTKQTQGTDTTKDSSADSTGKTTTVTLAAGQNNTTVDAGLTCSTCTSYTTYTQGGWGSCASGNNPGGVLKTNFSRVYPGGSVAIGGKYTLSFTSSSAIATFLPMGGTAAALTASQTNPTTACGVLAGQTLALELNVDFSNSGVTRPGLGALTIQSGTFVGKTISQFLAIANQALGNTSTGYTLTDIVNTANSINNNFDNGTQNLGYVK